MESFSNVGNWPQPYRRIPRMIGKRIEDASASQPANEPVLGMADGFLFLMEVSESAMNHWPARTRWQTAVTKWLWRYRIRHWSRILKTWRILWLTAGWILRSLEPFTRPRNWWLKPGTRLGRWILRSCPHRPVVIYLTVCLQDSIAWLRQTC